MIQVKGFFTFPLTNSLNFLTTMFTPFGKYVYNILAMGYGTDLFETCIHEVLQGLNGCTNIADDVLVHGSTYDEFKTNVLAFLDHCIQDMHLSPDKVKSIVVRYHSSEMFCLRMGSAQTTRRCSSSNIG